MFKFLVLTCLMAAASAQWLGAGLVSPLPYGAAPLGIASPWASPLGLGLGAPLASPLGLGAPLIVGANSRALAGSLAPGQPANILAADGRPLDTLEVNLDRAAHLNAKAIAGSPLRVLKKRSIVAAAPIAAAPLVASPLIARSSLALSPVGVSPISSIVSPISPLGLSSAGIISPLGARIAGPIGPIASPISPLGLTSAGIVSPLAGPIGPIAVSNSPLGLASAGIISPIGAW